jgi:hypothetical protein
LKTLKNKAFREYERFFAVFDGIEWVKWMPARRFLELGIALRFTNPRPTRHDRAMKMVSPEPEGFGAISRWSSAAIPPEIKRRECRILEGCQS